MTSGFVLNMLPFEWNAHETCLWIECGCESKSGIKNNIRVLTLNKWKVELPLYVMKKMTGDPGLCVCVCVCVSRYLNLRYEHVRFKMLLGHQSADMGYRRVVGWRY